MVCELCGTILGRSNTKTRDTLIDRIKEKMVNMSCEELYEESFTATYYHRYEAARQLLIERGHTEIEG